MLTVTVISILIVTVLVWLVNLVLPFQICPICAGVSVTWAWLLAAHFLGYQIVLMIPALLMGGTVVGLMFKLERLVKLKFVLVWKTVFVISGFLTADSLITGNWLLLVAGIIVVTIVTLAFRTRGIVENKHESEKIEELKQKMKSCC